MLRGWKLFAVAAVVATLAVRASEAGAQPVQQSRSVVPAAKVGDEIITLDEVEQSIRPQLAKLEEQRYQLLANKLEQLIGDRLLAQEAKRRGISVEQLLKTEVYAKAGEVTDAEVDNFISERKAQLPQGKEVELRLKIWDYLRGQKIQRRRQSYIESLRARSKVTVQLAVPSAARLPVDASKGFVRGNKAAPVTIVEFSDFQCPCCKRATPIVKQVLEHYPGKVKWVFRDFPIASLHPDAPKAAEAARCAAEQGKFWEYHDVLFEKAPQLSIEELKRYAKDLKLDSAAFAKCLDSGKQAAAVKADIEQGDRLGITGTPTFFINGRQLVGAEPLATFEKIIDTELSQKAP